MKLNNEKTSASVSVNADLSTVQLETLIADLIVLRAQMSPEVPLSVSDQNSEGVVLEQDDPYLNIKLLEDGRIRLWLRNQGFGWIAFNLPVDKACAIRDYLALNTPDDANTAPDFFSDDISNGAHH